jgi:hypothetical protein
MIAMEPTPPNLKQEKNWLAVFMELCALSLPLALGVRNENVVFN